MFWADVKWSKKSWLLVSS